MHANHVKSRLAAGEPSVGTWLSLPSPEGAEYVSRLGFDWLVIDAEHSAIDVRTMAQMFMAMAGCSPASRQRPSTSRLSRGRATLSTRGTSAPYPYPHPDRR